jgi:hypothetical protein
VWADFDAGSTEARYCPRSSSGSTPTSTHYLLLFELGPYPGYGGNVVVVKGIDEMFVH